MKPTPQVFGAKIMISLMTQLGIKLHITKFEIFSINFSNDSAIKKIGHAILKGHEFFPLISFLRNIAL